MQMLTLNSSPPTHKHTRDAFPLTLLAVLREKLTNQANASCPRAL